MQSFIPVISPFKLVDNRFESIKVTSTPPSLPRLYSWLDYDTPSHFDVICSLIVPFFYLLSIFNTFCTSLLNFQNKSLARKVIAALQRKNYCIQLHYLQLSWIGQKGSRVKHRIFISRIIIFMSVFIVNVSQLGCTCQYKCRIWSEICLHVQFTVIRLLIYIRFLDSHRPWDPKQ